MRIASLFSGVGGFELGLERAGWGETAFQCEIDAACREVLERHWPCAARVEDVRAVESVNADVICAGFPCQDLSQAARGRNEGLQGGRSGLWFEVLRIVEASRTAWVFLENVAGAAERRWLPVVRRGLHWAGYASVPLRVRACDVGAPQRGARTFVAAAPYSESKSVGALNAAPSRLRPVAEALCVRGWPSAPRRGVAVVDGVPASVALRMYGNAVVPRMAECVGRTLLCT